MDSGFGYLVDNPLFGVEVTNGGTSILSENENRTLENFFAFENPFLESQQAAFNIDAKAPFDEYSWNFPPANVHQVSTTIPDQAQLHRSFHDEHAFAPDALSANHLTNTRDDLQAASTLFNNAQAPHANSRSYSVPSVSSMRGLALSSTAPPNLNGNAYNSLPLVTSPHGMLGGQLAPLTHNHRHSGSIDAQIAAQFASSQGHQHRAADRAQLEQHRPDLKRSYTYGTDNNFIPSGYVAPPAQDEESITERLLHDLRTAEPLARPPEPSDDENSSPGNRIKGFPIGLVKISSDGEEPSRGETSDDDDHEDRPAKKRRKAKNSSSAKTHKAPTPQRKSISGSRSGKSRKASVDEEAGKKKRLSSSASQKAQRENLSEEQKRNNHILSEQKRRNLIKRGFDDLHDLVPEIRNGGLSKSGILMEAAAFLEKLINDNREYLRVSGGDADR